MHEYTRDRWSHGKNRLLYCITTTKSMEIDWLENSFKYRELALIVTIQIITNVLQHLITASEFIVYVSLRFFFFFKNLKMKMNCHHPLILPKISRNSWHLWIVYHAGCHSGEQHTCSLSACPQQQQKHVRILFQISRFLYYHANGKIIRRDDEPFYWDTSVQL